MHIDILNGLSIFYNDAMYFIILQCCIYTLVIFLLTYVICMCDFMTCFVRNDEIKLWNH